MRVEQGQLKRLEKEIARKPSGFTLLSLQDSMTNVRMGVCGEESALRVQALERSAAGIPNPLVPITSS